MDYDGAPPIEAYEDETQHDEPAADSTARQKPKPKKAAKKKEVGNSEDDQKRKQLEYVQKLTERMNKSMCVVDWKGKIRVLTEFQNRVTGRIDYKTSSFPDIINKYSNQKIQDPYTGKWITQGKCWLENPNRRQYEDVDFIPQPHPSIKKPMELKDVFNFWRGFGREPKKGGSWDLLFKHTRDILCGGNEEYFNYLLAWIARILQDPGGERPGTAVVIKGKKGVGKGTFINWFKEILGNHFLAVSRIEDITGKFNFHLKDTILLYCDEGYWAGNKSAEGVLKQLITEPYIALEKKGEDKLQIKSHVNIFMTSNEEHVVPATIEERRFFVLQASDEYLTTYPDIAERIEKIFKPIYKQMNNGGIEAMFYDLLHMDISDINLRAAPRTKALWDQMKRSNDPFEQWWRDCLTIGINTKEGVWSQEPTLEDIYTYYLSFLDDINKRGIRLEKSSFAKKLKEFCCHDKPEKAKDFKTRPRDNGNGARPSRYKIGPCTECREAYQKLLRFNVNWEDEGGISTDDMEKSESETVFIQ